MVHCPVAPGLVQLRVSFLVVDLDQGKSVRQAASGFSDPMAEHPRISVQWQQLLQVAVLPVPRAGLAQRWEGLAAREPVLSELQGQQRALERLELLALPRPLQPGTS